MPNGLTPRVQPRYGSNAFGPLPVEDTSFQRSPRANAFAQASFGGKAEQIANALRYTPARAGDIAEVGLFANNLRDPAFRNALAQPPTQPVAGKLDVDLFGDITRRGSTGGNILRLNPQQMQMMSAAMPLMTAFHGTPHRFDKFDSSKIGTGEGAQAYGHGIYFAESKDVAKTYVPRNYDVEDALMARYKAAESRMNSDPHAVTEMEIYESAMLHETSGDIRKAFSDPEVSPYHDAGVVERTLGELEDIEKLGAGNLLEVDISDDVIDRMLDWDKPLSEQPEVMKFIEDSVLPEELEELLDGFNADLGELSGGEGYILIKRAGGNDAVPNLEIEYTRALQDDERASMLLNQAGIPGIKYFDAGSRSLGAAEGTRNFVVFDDTIPKIINRE